MRSLGRCVPEEWVARELRVKGKLNYDSKALPTAEEHLLLRFKTKGDREATMANDPVVARQLLTMDRWQPDFIPGVKCVHRVLAWIRLPRLPVEYWERESIREIAAAAGRLVAVDEFTERQCKLGFARVRVELDTRLPLKPRLFVQSPSERFWQAFVNESLLVVCYRYGQIGGLLVSSSRVPLGAGGPEVPGMDPGAVDKEQCRGGGRLVFEP
ncbi:uncharacterized protein LOC103697297 [Phoenix dactylifera]|uniref:Uncharacterized protein LOC103697297 n=1 Tax=Phoenix dactylifera TaxID=42345 RepID=A0A8B7BIG3_PHODC|nr:uncharacterized protein LOC103697297 [Phoenix dactylifera]